MQLGGSKFSYNTLIKAGVKRSHTCIIILGWAIFIHFGLDSRCAPIVERILESPVGAGKRSGGWGMVQVW